MLIEKPVFSTQPAIVKLLALILIVLFSTFICFFISILLSVPFYGKGVLQVLTGGTDLLGTNEINVMKFLQMGSQVGMFIFPSLIFAWLSYGNADKTLKINKLPNIPTFLLTTILVFTMLPGIHFLIELNETLRLPEFLKVVEDWMLEKENDALRLTEAFLNTGSFGGLIVNLFMIGVLASIGEELLFRAVLIKILREWFKNTHLAVIVSAIIFSAFHLQFYGFLPRFVLGLVFGYLFVWSGSVWLPISAHFLNNGSAVVISFLSKNGMITTNADDFGTVENLPLLLASIVITLVILGVIFLYEKQRSYRSL